MGRHVLLPRDDDRLENITVLRAYLREDGQVMTIFLKDLSLLQHHGREDQMFWAGFVAICERVPTDDGLCRHFLSRMVHRG